MADNLQQVMRVVSELAAKETIFTYDIGTPQVRVAPYSGLEQCVSFLEVRQRRLLTQICPGKIS